MDARQKISTFNCELRMCKLIRSWNWAFLSLLGIYFFSSCEKKDERDTFIPFLTDKVWRGDTMTINPPFTYEQLSIEDQQSLHTAILWFKNAQITLNENGSVTTGGDYDLGYKEWKLIDNDADIEMTMNSGKKLIFRNWSADPFSFSYTRSFTTAQNNSFDCTVTYR
jgi:hypothetical protein